MTLASQVTLLATRIGQEIKRHTPLVQTSAPASPFVGQEWLDTDEPAILPLPSGAWTVYVPTVSGMITQGNAVRTGGYTQIGKTVHFWAQAVCGTTSAYSGSQSINVSLPVTAKAGSNNASLYCLFTKSGLNYYVAPAIMVTTLASCYALGAAGAFVIPTPTVPFTWATNDIVEVHGTYEAA